ncbi:epoxyalkane--coenzyme M transferase [Xylanimonas oleitrophica]|uniref:Epoxyalkane--coenzyme M transferase n=1 Tax=Xylanimonas oleitrophica TaxID=2607479 RepID=A0A2W5WQZ5_9MICO|nr:cobalamin-independent methionine synthase II family protein [Xylanimonas oleitrophica]PZR53540.1 epoxyalkane--coenzyme M transferase [Xylanimonas oleitrophica]
MPSSTDRILTTHVGSLPRSPRLLEANAARAAGRLDPDEHRALLGEAVADVVRQQVETGIDIVNDGEYGHTSTQSVDYGAWWTYSFDRTGGLEVVDNPALAEPHRSAPGKVELTSFLDRRDFTEFADAYGDPTSGIHLADPDQPPPAFPTATGPLRYTGQDAVAADVAHLKAAAGAAGAHGAFVAALSPGSAARIGNKHYASDEEFVYAWADVLREEYTAILDAGLDLQLDDPSLAESWDQVKPEPAVEDYQKWVQVRVEALNHALRGLPTERVRLHVCWGSWHGPHSTDLPFEHIVDQVLQADVGGYSFEAANVRHEHEWRVWEDRTLPEGKVIVPGVVSHATNVVEHPRLVADRIERFARLVGKENVIASTDCGLGGRIHPQIAWAKLRSLTEGARIASQELWG